MERAWIVFTDDEVEAVLMSPAFAVRPPGEPAPAAMKGTPLAPIFVRLARMNDGRRHARLRALVEQGLSEWDLQRVRSIAEDAAVHVPPQDVAALTVATMAGVADAQAVLPWIRDFAAAVTPGASDDAIAKGAAAVEPLLAALPPCGGPDETANVLGLLFQSYAPTARLIANMRTGRSDPPVVLTRRYACEDTTIGSNDIRRGEAVVVLLVAPRYHFGTGRHRCPGERIAQTIAQAACSAHRRG